jgi:DNA polymerase-4
MDAFFASVEQRDVPSLRGKPVIVGGEREGRGIVSAASYEAREYGVHSAMSMRSARTLCPHAVFVQGNWAKYVQASLEVFATCRSVSPGIEVVSVDECTLPIADEWDDAVAKARSLSRAITRIHHLSCSIGIAPNRMLAKLASSIDKPGGFTPLHPKDLPGSISSLCAASVWGIGEKSFALLAGRGIRTIGDLVGGDPTRIRRVLGERAVALVRSLCGAPDQESAAIRERSLGHEFTFGHDVQAGPLFWAVVSRLCDQVSRRLRVGGLQGSVVRARLRWSDFETHTRQTVIRADLHDPLTLRSIARALIQRMLIPERSIRLVGITAAGLFQDVMLSFDAQLFPRVKRQRLLVRAVDRVWDRYGEDSLFRASSLLA